MKTFSLACAKSPTPILNTQNFRRVFGGEDGTSLPLDNQKLLRATETVAFGGTLFKILHTSLEQPYIVQVETESYPSQEPLFVDKRFLGEILESSTHVLLEEPQEILKKMKDLLGARYIWGGSWPNGVPQLLDYYPPSRSILDPLIRDTWQLKGVDCSGLIYYATNGHTPRNTSAMLSFGKAVSIQSCSVSEIVEKLQPLDLIVWKGHVVCVFNKQESIESLLGKGVVTHNLTERLTQITTELKRTPVDEYVGESLEFVVRRWHPRAHLLS